MPINRILSLSWPRSLRPALLLTALFALLCLSISAVHAAPPTLETVPGDDLKSAYQTGQKVTFRLNYKDADGDRIKKAQFIDEDTSAPYDYKTIEGGTPESGENVVWQINGFESGAHKGYFLVTNTVGETARYPDDQDKRYTFTVQNVATKWGITIGGIVACLIFLPFLVYLGARSANRQGNPSSAARIGLLIGIFASLALFIYEFVGVYDPLILAIGGVVALALLIIVLARR